MKKLLCVLIMFFGFNSLSFAGQGDHFLLPKIGFMVIDLHETDPLISVGVLYGYGLSNRFSVEGELNYGFSGGEYTTEDNETGEYRIWTAAGYGVFRLPIWDTGYLKAKVGGLYENVTRNSEQREDREDDDFGVAGGLGLGALLWGKATLELEATVIDKDIVFYSIGAHFSF